MKYPEEILREKIELLEISIEAYREDRDKYKERLEWIVQHMSLELWTLRQQFDEACGSLIETLEDIEDA